MSEANRAPAVEVNVAPVDDSSPAPSVPLSPTVVIPPTTDPEVTRLAQELGTAQSDLTTMRAELDAARAVQGAELAQLRTRMAELEALATEPAELEEIDVPPMPAPVVSAAVPVAAKPERGFLAKMFLGQ